MIRGTTTQFKFTLPYTKEEIEFVTIKFWQKNNHALTPITRGLADCANPLDSKELSVSLTAEETLRFSEKYKGRVQLRGMCKNTGTVFASKQQLFTVYPLSDDLSGDITVPPNDEGWVILDGDVILT